MILYRIYAPYHKIVSGGTIECGIYETPEEATGRLVEIFNILGSRDNIETEWVSPILFRATVQQGDVKSVVVFRLVKYELNRKIFENMDFHPPYSVLSNN